WNRPPAGNVSPVLPLPMLQTLISEANSRDPDLAPDLLIVVAARAEHDAVVKPLRAIPNNAQTILLVQSGVGKSSAATATAATLAQNRFRIVLNAGIAGALPLAGEKVCRVGDVVLGSRSVFADEGIREPGGFRTCEQMGFPVTTSGMAVPGDAEMLKALKNIADHTGPIATVSTCSGTDGAAVEIARRTGAIAEAMEGAAVGLAAERAGARFAELRVISNLTGDRHEQDWDLPGSLARLGEVTAEAAARLLPA
ncbi:MAG: futalosine hydrolase, partial [Planctomycetota bacterium]